MFNTLIANTNYVIIVGITRLCRWSSSRSSATRTCSPRSTGPRRRFLMCVLVRCPPEGVSERKVKLKEDTVGNPQRAQTSQFELFVLILLLKVDKPFSIEQFELTISLSTVNSPPLLASSLLPRCSGTSCPSACSTRPPPRRTRAR